jgi:hemolysin type calcium-binding protein
MQAEGDGLMVGAKRMLGAWMLLALGATALALAFSGLGRAASPALTSSASGALRIAGSDGNRAILRAGNLAPGEQVRGAAEIRNASEDSAALSLAALGLHDVAGSGGGLLSGKLWLTVRDVTSRADAIVYAGPFADLGTIRAGALAPGERRRYEFTAALPDAGPASLDDSFAGASTGIDYRWTLTGGAGARCATQLDGDAGTNRVIGTVGGDRIRTGAGGDWIYADEGRDCIEPGPGRDRVFASPGDDVIDARDGVADTIGCSAGDDVVYADPVDVTRHCETVR